MRKAYNKPEIIFESFKMTESIARNCTHIINTHSQNACGVEFGGQTLFVDTVSVCTWAIDDGNTNDGICYHVPIPGNTYFNS